MSNQTINDSPIPSNAVEIIQETWGNGNKKRTSYHVDGKEIGFRYWDETGLVDGEVQTREGQMHGLFRTWHGNGQIFEIAIYNDGKEHGESKQYDDNGLLVGSYVMEYGTGVDLWFHAQGVLFEEREFIDGYRHGFERWWRGDNETINEESHFWKGSEHGIFRRWNRHGKLSRGYPQYFVMGKRITKRQYVTACRNDPTLPIFRAEDSLPFRQLPKTMQQPKA
jgi:antitoxin component YwqK of YwqJK toxin-antitoxin module